MGQYQQWLRYQDIEQSLRKTQHALEVELAELESQLDTVFFEQIGQHEFPLNSNPVITALLAALHSPATFPARPFASFSSSSPPEVGTGEAGQADDEPAPEDVTFLDQLQMVFATLLPEEVEQFYTAYQKWLLQKRIEDVRQRLATLQEQLDANETRMRYYRPAPIALASLARLQANGVNDIELLDQMLERGEAWLDVTMQRLSYCEQFENFLSDDYTQWCRRALDGAFDWIDSLRMVGSPGENGTAPAATSEELPPGIEDAGEAEAMLLQKLSAEADDDENEEGMAEEAENSQSGDTTDPVDEPEQPDNSADSQETVVLDPSPGEEDARQEEPIVTAGETSKHSGEQSTTAEEPVSTIGDTKKQGAMRRLVAKLWGE
jgi:hypothetical protein